MISFDDLLDTAAESSSVSPASRSEYASLETPAYVVSEDFNWDPASPMVYQPVYDPATEEDENLPMVKSLEPVVENLIEPVTVKENLMKPAEPVDLKLVLLKPPEKISKSDNFQFKIPSNDLKCKSTRRDDDSKSKSRRPKDLKCKSTRRDDDSKSLKPKDSKCKFPKNDSKSKLGSRKDDDLKVESLQKSRREEFSLTTHLDMTSKRIFWRHGKISAFLCVGKDGFTLTNGVESVVDTDIADLAKELRRMKVRMLRTFDEESYGLALNAKNSNAKLQNMNVLKPVKFALRPCQFCNRSSCHVWNAAAGIAHFHKIHFDPMMH